MLWKLLVVAIVFLPLVAVETSPSMFLHLEAYKSVVFRNDTLFCPYKNFTASHAEPIVTTFNKHAVFETLIIHKGTIVQHRHLMKSSNLRVAVDAHYGESAYGMAFFSPLIPFMSSFAVSGPESLLCFEMALLTNEIDVFMPVWTDPPITLSQYHSVSVLEEHFGVPFIMPSGAIAHDFTNKSYFAEWMHINGLGSFVPEQYTNPDQAKYPCVIKIPTAVGGRGVLIANNRKELNDALTKLGDQAAILQEALTGSQEPIIHFIAYNGKILSSACFIHNEKENLFVTGVGKYALHGGKVVSCKDIDAIAPLSDITRKLLQRSMYNGFGCINFKLAANKKSVSEIDHLLSSLPTVNAATGPHLNTDFGADDASSEWEKYDGVAKMFDFNARLCGSHVLYHIPEINPMIEMYHAEFMADA